MRRKRECPVARGELVFVVLDDDGADLDTEPGTEVADELADLFMNEGIGSSEAEDVLIVFIRVEDCGNPFRRVWADF